MMMLVQYKGDKDSLKLINFCSAKRSNDAAEGLSKANQTSTGMGEEGTRRVDPYFLKGPFLSNGQNVESGPDRQQPDRWLSEKYAVHKAVHAAFSMFIN